MSERMLRAAAMAVVVVLVLGGATQVSGVGSFLPYQAYPVGKAPSGVVAADFNGDGRPDMATANSDAGTMTVYLAQGRRTFGARTDFTTGQTPYDVVCGDFNADNIPDLVVSNGGGTDLSLFYGTGGGGFAPQQRFGFTLGPPGNPRYIVAGDFNADDRPDLAVAYSSGAQVCVFTGRNGGGFNTPTSYASVAEPWALVAADFNGDQRLDLGVSCHYGSGVAVHDGQAGGSFATPTAYSTDYAPLGLTPGDFNKDGRMDLAIVHQNSTTVIVYYGQSNGTLGGKRQFAIAAYAYDVVAGDFDEDGMLDLACAAATTVNLLHGTAGGGFGAVEVFPIDGSRGYRLDACDLDLDGHLDLLIASGQVSSVSILYNSLPEPATLALLAAGGLAVLRRRRK